MDVADDDTETIRLLCVEQLVLPEDVPASSVEEGELLMLDELRRFAWSISGAHVVRGSIRQSAQTITRLMRYPLVSLSASHR